MDVWARVAVLSLGGALGTNARYWVGVWAARWVGPRFPWATFAINVSGSFAIGFLSVALGCWSAPLGVRLLVLVGFLGGYTTFSTFAFDSLALLERGDTGLAVANAAGSVVAGLVAVALGAGLARASVDPSSTSPDRAGPPPAVRVEPGGPSLPTSGAP